MAVQYLDDGRTDGSVFGNNVNSNVPLIGFYGKAPSAQRAGAIQATSVIGTASSTALDTVTKATIIEIMNTLTASGLWKGSA